MSSFPIWYMLIFLKVPPLVMIGLLFWAAGEKGDNNLDQGEDGGGGQGPCPDDGRRTPGGPVHERGCRGEKERAICRAI